MQPPVTTDLLARELSGLLDGSACLQIKLPALGEIEAAQGQRQANDQGQSQGNEPGRGLALSRWRGLRR
ncbi:hypothetical protein [Prochlorococcus sp. MIT 1201]|uniref:hypothetical protein n=1 Tax=Prochlorococcus sp. MIT 1201 TaxID=3082535 RepID=UPI0039A6CFD4